MEKKECFIFFIEKGNTGIKPTENNIKNNFPDLYLEMGNYLITKEWILDFNFGTKFYCFLNDLKSLPRCKECGEKTKFKQFSFGFSEFCSSKCSAINKDTRKKCEETCLSNYGHVNIAHGLIGEKIKETFNIKYGGHPSKNISVKKKKDKTFDERYGGHPFSNLEIKQKIKETWVNNYGVDNPLKNKEIQEKVLNTKYERGILVDWLKNPELVEDFNRYKKIVHSNTEITFKKHYYEINPERNKRSKDKWHLDHIYPIIEGWKNNIDPILISDRKNLQMLWYKENQSKCGRTDMTPEDFFKMIKK
jgi:hypothetical protein